MSDYVIYLEMPLYLAQWYADECQRSASQEQETLAHGIYQFPTPVKPIRGSQEADILEYHLDKQPNNVPANDRANATIAIAIPYFKNKDPRTYNYLSQEAKRMLIESIRTRFKIQMWHYVQRFEGRHIRKDLLVESYMALHNMDVNNETVCLAVMKIYQRKKNVYDVLKSRKKSTSSDRKKVQR